MIKFFRYRGSKTHIVSVFNEMIKTTSKKRYIEPFLGSGAVFINLPDVFDEYVINDVDENIVLMWKAVLNFSYDDFVAAKNFIFNKFGDIKTDKESYYNFRNSYNENLHGTYKRERGLFLYFLTNSCINSLLRFGPNGMNQSFGARSFFMSEDEYNVIRGKLLKSKITCVDYRTVLTDLWDSIIYLDPPYCGTAVSYKQEFDVNSLKDFTDTILNLDSGNDIFYSDLDNEISDRLLNFNFKKILTKKIANISPNRKEQGNRDEFLYFKQE